LASPQRVAVLEESKASGKIPLFVILYPREGDIINEREVHIAISIFDPDSDLDIVDATGVKEKGTAQAGGPVFVLK
jgi:hypothetical protein